MAGKLSTNMSDKIYEYLFNMILSTEIKPGDRISENDIATRFNVSRTPVRTALQNLGNQGILNIYPNRFAEVAVYDEERVREIGITKIVLDRLAVKLASYYGSRADFDNMQVLADKCYSAASKKEIAERIRADSRFHMKLCEIGKNRSLIDMQKTLVTQTEFLQAARYLKAEDPKIQYEVHTEIVNALREGRLEEALQIITEPSISFYNVSDVPQVLYL